MSLEYELHALSAEALVETFDARIASADNDDIDASLRQAGEYTALMELCDHASNTYANTGGGEINPDAELRAFHTGALTVLVTLMQHAKNQDLKERLGL